jgi:hypothetical protein
VHKLYPQARRRGPSAETQGSIAMSSVLLSPPNAMLFLIDPRNKAAEVPPYVDGQLVASTPSCISVGTRASVDGETEVTLTRGDLEPRNLVHVATVNIALPMGNIAVVTSEFEVILREEARKEVEKVSIWVDDGRNPSKVFIKIES